VTAQESMKLVLPNDMSYLRIAQLTVREVARKFGFQGDHLLKIELAIEEAVTNVIEHAFETGEKGTYEIICERIPLGIRIIIKEKGIPFDPARHRAYDPAKDLDDAATTGLGLFLMKEAMDELSFHNLGAEGKETHLVKYLYDKSIDKLCQPSDLAAPEVSPGPVVIKEKIPYDIRGLEPQEAIEVSKCAYKSHGYTFFEDHIYYPDRIIELNNSGQMVSSVAVTKDKVFMGHTALVYPYPGARIAELTFAFVNVEYRGQGCLNGMVEYLFKTPKKFPLAGIYAYAVTNHVFTQKSMVKYGIGDCGILLATSPDTWVFKGIDNDRRDAKAQRISVVIAYKYMEPPAPLTLYPPPHHREMIERLYTNIQSADHRYATPAEGASKLPEESSVIETEYFPSESCAEMRIDRYGADVLREVRRALREMCLKQIACINLFVNLEDPATYFLTSELEKMGFFFAGILPQTAIGDSLILQYLNNVPFDYDKLAIYTDLSKDILAYIKRLDPNIVE